MASTSNPAGRLHTILARAAAAPNSRDGLLVRDALSRGLELPEDATQALFLRRYGMLVDLPQQIREGVSYLPAGGQELYLRHLDTFEAALQFPLTQKWTQKVWPAVAGAPMESLEFASHALDTAQVEPAVDPAAVVSLRTKVDSLLAEVLSSSIDENLRVVLARHAQKMRLAIDEVGLRGAGALLDAAEAALGGFVLWEGTHGEPENSADLTLWRQALGMFKEAAEAVGAWAVVLGLSAGTAPAQLPPPPATEIHTTIEQTNVTGDGAIVIDQLDIEALAAPTADADAPAADSDDKIVDAEIVEEDPGHAAQPPGP
jgi:hypothetical protein